MSDGGEGRSPQASPTTPAWLALTATSNHFEPVEAPPKARPPLIKLVFAQVYLASRRIKSVFSPRSVSFVMKLPPCGGRDGRDDE